MAHRRLVEPPVLSKRRANRMTTPDRGINITEEQSAEHIKEKHLQMVMDRLQAGREVPAVAVNPEFVGEELARTSVEASQKTMKKATKRSFVVPMLPWLRNKNSEVSK
jgi:hypothetical protein